ncbi:MAG TPA: TadE/TadG family type IV pilus assembly protein [Xanthobacteraceae bacterium]|nr:TadE/TadG family type IV pilus assembly protein [Xanthobacteraceae bacterium]
MLNALQSQIRAGVFAARRQLAAFRRDKRGNVAIITALAAIPMLAAIGCVIDYTYASMVKTKLQAAADSATLATVSNNSPIVASAKTSGTVTNGVTYAKNFFNADVTAITNSGNMNIAPAATVTMSGNTMTATVSFTASVPTFFMGAVTKLMGASSALSSVSVSGSSTATYSLPTYINFYMMVDVSGSMSMASTAAEQTRLQSVNPDNMHSNNNQGYPSGCTFACHFANQACSQTSSNGDPWQGAYPTVGQNIPSQWPSSSGGYPGGYCMGFIITRLGTSPTTLPTGCLNDSNGSCGKNNVNWTNSQVSSCPTAGTTSCIQLRMDAVGYAVTQLLTYAQNTESNTNTSNEFAVGIYPFIQNLCYSSAGSSNSCSVGLTTNLTGSTIQNFAAQLASLLDTGNNSTLGSGGTHFENAFSTMNSSVITSVGTGTSTSPLPYLFLITDGSQDYQTQWNGNWGSQNWSSNSSVPYQNSATVIPPNTVTSTNYCQTMKNRGITIAVLYVPYQTIANANANFADNEDGYANNNIPNIPAALQSCASPNFFYTASTPADIQTALIQMFNQAVSTAHISH